MSGSVYSVQCGGIIKESLESRHFYCMAKCPLFPTLMTLLMGFNTIFMLLSSLLLLLLFDVPSLPPPPTRAYYLHNHMHVWAGYVVCVCVCVCFCLFVFVMKICLTQIYIHSLTYSVPFTEYTNTGTVCPSCASTRDGVKCVKDK